MTLRFVPDVRQRVAATLRAFFETDRGTDLLFDQGCGWPRGTTRAFLDCERQPDHHEIMEICLRMKCPLSDFVVTTWIDS